MTLKITWRAAALTVTLAACGGGGGGRGRRLVDAELER